MDLIQQFRDYIKHESLFQKADRLLLAVSGGVDSVVLTELCHRAGYQFEIAHCNFQLRGADSDRDEAFVIALAGKYGVPVHVKRFETAAVSKATKKSFEETARDLRYAWFHELLTSNSQLSETKSRSISGPPTSNPQPPTFIVTAHHADDNIETVLMNFFRGTGIKGLHGILPRQSKIIRPLLFAWKTDLEEYARLAALEFVTDHTNAEVIYTRNFFRNRLIPMIEEVYPGVRQNLMKNIGRLGEAEILYEEAIALHKKKLLEQKGNEWHIPVLKLEKTVPLRTVTWEIIREYGFTANQVEEVLALLNSESGKYIKSSSHRIIRNRKWLIISPNESIATGHILIEGEEDSVKFALGSLQFKKLSNDLQLPTLPAGRQAPTPNLQLPTSNQLAMLDASQIKYPLLLRKWKTGDYFYPLGMRKKKKLSRFFIDTKLSLTEKEKVWVLESGKKIIWVIGMRIDDRFKINGSTRTVLKIELKNP
ncbi:MAG: tRNA lysidine(34) synthetase TilS [Chitinophagaceae bacterium]|nr:tRNA lysidine(34) synthetase TilS [Chitinophagaceae bacterium]